MGLGMRGRKRVEGGFFCVGRALKTNTSWWRRILSSSCCWDALRPLDRGPLHGTPSFSFCFSWQDTSLRVLFIVFYVLGGCDNRPRARGFTFSTCLLFVSNKKETRNSELSFIMQDRGDNLRKKRKKKIVVARNKTLNSVWRQMHFHPRSIDKHASAQSTHSLGTLTCVASGRIGYPSGRPLWLPTLEGKKYEC